jgi:peptide-methionine (S)-S-oxide reductase
MSTNANGSDSSTLQFATLGGGCFWCLEAVFQRIKGVNSVVSGYTGGDNSRADYKSVCKGNTGHAEVIQIQFDPAAVTFEQLLDVFFTIHDPTTLNRQGADVGTQYRSEIFCHDEQQKQIAEQSIARINQSGKFPSRIVTAVSMLGLFIPAEEYHQNYFNQNPYESYCQYVVIPKVVKAVKEFPHLTNES